MFASKGFCDAFFCQFKRFWLGDTTSFFSKDLFENASKKKNNKNGGFCVPYLPTLRFFHLSTH